MSDDEIPIADEPDTEALISLDRFRRRLSGRFGVIVIDDKAREQPIAHDLRCGKLTKDHFIEKVLDMGGRQGRYFWAKDSRIAGEKLGARRCRHPSDRLARGSA